LSNGLEIFILKMIIFYALLAQLDRVTGFEPVGRGFESLRVRHSYNNIFQTFFKSRI
jgi:hypothetical protein